MKPEAAPTAWLDYDADEDPFFECTACGLRSYHDAETTLDRVGEAITCRHCGTIHAIAHNPI